MDQQQRELRRAAAQAFIESLDKLPETLSSANNHQKSAIAPQSAELVEFENAVADIEQFLQVQQSTSPNSEHLM